DRQLSLSDKVAPVLIHRGSAVKDDLVEARSHLWAGLAGLNEPHPSGLRSLFVMHGALRNLAPGLVTHLMAAGAAVGVHYLADPLALALDAGRNTVPAGPRAGEIALRRD